MKTIKIKIVRSVLACIALITLTHCDFVFKNEEINEDELLKTKSSITMHKDEAKLLVTATQHNLDVVELIQVVKEVEKDTTITKIANNIEDMQLHVFNTYNRAAKDNIISIPANPNVDKENYLAKNTDEVVVDVIEKIDSKINKQIDMLDTLASTSDNQEFKELALNATEKLALSLSKTNMLKEHVMN